MTRLQAACFAAVSLMLQSGQEVKVLRPARINNSRAQCLQVVQTDPPTDALSLSLTPSVFTLSSECAAIKGKDFSGRLRRRLVRQFVLRQQLKPRFALRRPSDFNDAVIYG